MRGDTTMRTHFVNELEAVRQDVIAMGETTIALLAAVMRAVVNADAEAVSRASELESQTDHLHRMIHDRCLNLIARQAPVARDARLLTGILDAIVDLELIADYAYEIVSLSPPPGNRPPSQIVNQLSELGAKIRDLLSSAIDIWRSEDPAGAISVRSRDAAIRAECVALDDKLARLVSGPGDGRVYLNLLLIGKHFERILRHAVCVADQAAAAAPLAQSE